MGVLIIGDNGIQNSINPATRSAPWPLTAAKAATGIRRMHFLNIQMICTLTYDDECMAFTADRGGIYCKVTVTAEYISITWPRSQVDIF